MAVFLLKWPSKLFELYIKSSLHVALAAASLAYVTVYELEISADPLLFGFIFSSTVLSYNFTKYGYALATRPGSMGPLLKWIAGITAISFAVVCASLFYLPLNVIFGASLFGAITIAYAVPVSEGRQNLRSIYGIKIAVIALVWLGVTVGLPVLNHGFETLEMTAIVYEAIQRFLFVAVLIIPFDIRDYRSDEPALGTLPQIIGVPKSKILGLVLLSACLGIEAIGHSVRDSSFLVFSLIAVMTAFMVRRAMISQTRYYAAFWVEGIPVFWAILLCFYDSV